MSIPMQTIFDPNVEGNHGTHEFDYVNFNCSLYICRNLMCHETFHCNTQISQRLEPALKQTFKI